MFEITGLPSSYRTVLQAACEQAIDAGISDDVAFARYVTPIISAADPAVDRCLEHLTIPEAKSGPRAFLDALHARLKLMSRGTWCTVSGYPDCRYRGWMAHGSDRPKNAGVWGVSAYAKPSFQDIHESMRCEEIGLMRGVVMEERAREASIRAIEAHGIRRGVTFGDVWLDGQHYISAKVTSVRGDAVHVAVTTRNPGGLTFRRSIEISGLQAGRWVEANCVTIEQSRLERPATGQLALGF